MLLGERLRLALDAEELGDEILDVRRERDQQIRFCASRSAESLRAAASFSASAAIGSTEESEERAIDLDRPSRS